jgi:hypothetical protein
MQRYVDQMQRAGVGAEQLHVEHVREPGERVPIAQQAGGEGPARAVEGKAAAHDGVFADVARVVVLDEAVPVGLRVDGEDQAGGDGGERDLRAARLGQRRLVVRDTRHNARPASLPRRC